MIALLDEFQPDAVIETGTFLGLTTRFLAKSGLPVYSAEIKPEYYHIAKLNVRQHPNVNLVCGDSVDMLEHLSRNGDSIRRPFAYLDAHWWDQLPLSDEVSLVLDRWSDALLLIEDCRVPGDPGYQYDIYDGVPLTAETLPLPNDAIAAYPRASARDERGARTGTLYVGHGPAASGAMQKLIEGGVLVRADSTLA
jgi:predicted O-methyltransferase YrrM